MSEWNSRKEDIKDAGLFGLSVTVLVGFFFVLSILLSAGYLAYERWALPQHVDNENRAFQQSQAYNDGMAQQLAELRMRWQDTRDAGERGVIQATVRQMYGRYDSSKLPVELRGFLQEMRGF